MLHQKSNSSSYIFLRKRYLPTLWPIYNFWVGIEKKTGISTRKVFHIYEGNNYQARLDTKFVQEIGQWAFEELSKSNIKKIREKSHITALQLITVCQEFSIQAKKAPLEEFVSFYAKIDSLYQELFFNNMVYWVASDQKFSEELDKHLSCYTQTQRQEIISMMILSEEGTYSTKVDQEFFILVQKAKREGIDTPIAKGLMKDFSEKYIWFPFEYGGPNIYDEFSVEARLKMAMNEEVSHNDKRSDIVKKQREIIIRYQLSAEVIRLFEIIRQIAILQDDRKMYNAQICYFVNKLIVESLSIKLEIPQELLKKIDYRLLHKYFIDQNKQILLDELKERQKFLVVQCLNNEITITTGTVAQEILIQEGISLKGDVLYPEEIKGKSIFPGKVKGKVKIIKHSGEENRFKEGDVLVTGMTTPDFIILMKKAAAIITDEGGITCHAAIVARELKKPCIIGTKIATKVLHDGDLVEVDADKGIIKKLEANK